MGVEQADKPLKSSLDFFETRLRSHNRVSSLAKLGYQVYDVVRTDGSHVKTYITNLYTVGLADYDDIREKCPGVGAIVTISMWNGYSGDAKRQANEDKIGLFTLREFMGALHVRNLWSYTPPGDKKESV